jgi:hypothetical protein
VKKLIDECKDDSPDDVLNKMEALNCKFRLFIQDNDMEHVETFSGVNMSYADVIIHIVNHGTYHRGNVTAMLRQLGFKGTATDYGFYLHNMQMIRAQKIVSPAAIPRCKVSAREQFDKFIFQDYIGAVLWSDVAFVNFVPRGSLI